MILVNGLPNESVSATDRGLMYGDGVFRTLAVKQGHPQHLQRHLDKLSADCGAINLPDLDQASIRQDIALVTRDGRNGVLKIVITRGSGTRGYKIPSPSSPTRIVITAPLPDYPLRHSSQGVAVVMCHTRLAIPAPLAGVKSLNRMENVLARSEWNDATIAEGLMCTSDGAVISGTMSNFFYVRDGVLGTSDLRTCGVAGVQRDRILDHAKAHGIPLTMKPLHQADLIRAEELFLCNSLMGIWPIVACGELRWPVGPITRRLQSALFQSNDG